jgi:hypothetical protein
LYGQELTTMGSSYRNTVKEGEEEEKESNLYMVE